VGLLVCQAVRYLPPGGVLAVAHAGQFAAGAAGATVLVFYWSRNRYASLSAGAAGGVIWLLAR
jgi:hypothetical protein